VLQRYSMKLTHTVQLREDVYVALKGLWAEGSVRGLVDGMVRRELERRGLLGSTPPERSEVVEVVEPVRVKVRPALSALAQAQAVESVCRRCGHERAVHWVKGCLAGCTCSAGRGLFSQRGPGE